jgi:hypothetical protein
LGSDSRSMIASEAGMQQRDRFTHVSKTNDFFIHYSDLIGLS